MSRVGSNPIELPKGVEVRLAGRTVTAKGKMGEHSVMIDSSVEAALADGKITLRPRTDDKETRVRWGTAHSLVRGLVKGVNEGFTVNLEIVGVGYRAAVEGETLALQLGFSHDLRYPIPQGIKIRCERPTMISVAGVDKQKVGQVAAEIRAFRRPEPYKGKGIRYKGEYVLHKEGKKK
ncbi:MAG: 50S ribosomal protein L6 [Alphaproteobacteria bacterium]